MDSSPYVLSDVTLARPTAVKRFFELGWGWSRSHFHGFFTRQTTHTIKFLHTNGSMESQSSGQQNPISTAHDCRKRVVFFFFFSLNVILLLTKLWITRPDSISLPLHVMHGCTSITTSCLPAVMKPWKPAHCIDYDNQIKLHIQIGRNICKICYSEISSVIHSSGGTILLWGSTRCRISACSCWPRPAK